MQQKIYFGILNKKVLIALLLFLVVPILITAGVAYQIWSQPYQNSKAVIAVRINEVSLYNSFFHKNTYSKKPGMNIAALTTGKVKNMKRTHLVLIIPLPDLRTIKPKLRTIRNYTCMKKEEIKSGTFLFSCDNNH